MPIGYLVTVAFVALLTVFALAPIRRPRSLALLSWGLSLVINELPFLAFYWLLAATLLAFGQGDIDSAGGWVLFGLAVLTSVGLGVIALRGWRAGPAVARAMSEGPGCWMAQRTPPAIGRSAAAPSAVATDPVLADLVPSPRRRAATEYPVRRRGPLEPS
jgi:hypothetical protein